MVMSEDQMPPVQFINTEDDFIMIQVSIFILASWRFCVLHLIHAFCEGKKKNKLKPKPQTKKQNSLEMPIILSFFSWWVDSMEDYTYLLIAQFL